MRMSANEPHHSGFREADVSAVPAVTVGLAEQSALCPAFNPPVMHAKNFREVGNVIALSHADREVQLLGFDTDRLDRASKVAGDLCHRDGSALFSQVFHLFRSPQAPIPGPAAFPCLVFQAFHRPTVRTCNSLQVVRDLPAVTHVRQPQLLQQRGAWLGVFASGLLILEEPAGSAQPITPCWPLLASGAFAGASSIRRGGLGRC